MGFYDRISPTSSSLTLLKPLVFETELRERERERMEKRHALRTKGAGEMVL